MKIQCLARHQSLAASEPKPNNAIGKCYTTHFAIICKCIFICIPTFTTSAIGQDAISIRTVASEAARHVETLGIADTRARLSLALILICRLQDKSVNSHNVQCTALQQTHSCFITSEQLLLNEESRQNYLPSQVCVRGL